MSVHVRHVEPRDVPAVVRMVHDLAAFERSAELCELTTEQLEAALFTERPALFGHVAVTADADTPIGVALWFLNFSTWRGTHGVYLEDLFVAPEGRRAGVATALLSALAGICVARGYTRLDWAVLDWNTSAHDFYRALGARPEEDWTGWRLTGDPLVALARRG